MDEDTLREKARTVISKGKLPTAPRPHVGRSGLSVPHARLRLPVRPTEMEFEIQFARDGDNPGLDKSTSTSAASRRGSSSGRAAETSAELPLGRN